MTPVHLNRVLQDLRRKGLIEFESQVLTVLDPPRLKKLARFEADYLHLVRTAARDQDVSERAGDLVSPSAHGVVASVVNKVKNRFSSE